MRRDDAAMIDSRLNPVFATDLYLALPKPDVDLMPVNRHDISILSQNKGSAD
jgi:hypothetical protein